MYNGPLDLLLYLIKRDELDIYDIPIARITDSYVGYVKMLRGLGEADGLDINLAGEFLVMAATLMEIKSATLLPKAPVEAGREGQPSAAEELSDPRAELPHGPGDIGKPAMSVGKNRNTGARELLSELGLRVVHDREIWLQREDELHVWVE